MTDESGKTEEEFDLRAYRGTRRYTPDLDQFGGHLKDAMSDVNEIVPVDDKSVAHLGAFGERMEAAAKNCEERAALIRNKLESLMQVYAKTADHLRAMAKERYEVDNWHDRRLEETEKLATTALSTLTQPFVKGNGQ